MDQSSLDKFAETLGIKYSVLDNLTDGRNAYSGSIHITNNCHLQLEYGKWGIYFCQMQMMEPEHLKESEFYVYENTKLQIKHINGCLFALEPVDGFPPLKNGETIDIHFKAEYHSVAKTDVFPNWYIAMDELEPRVIKSTSGEGLEFVSDFDKPEKWKRFDYELPNGVRRRDLYDPWSAEVRYHHNSIEEAKSSIKPIVPTPFKLDVKSGDNVDLSQPGWTVWSCDKFRTEATQLAEKLGLKVTDISEKEAGDRERTILVTCGEVTDTDVPGCSNNSEAYKLEIDLNTIRLHALFPAGIFYAGQSLLRMVQSDQTVPRACIVDFPRFKHRGTHLDVSRNFHTKDEILCLLDLMSMYKLNKLHLHLSDDQGWRLEIPGLEELSKVGGQRGHDLKEEQCLLPVLGSGPAVGVYPGSGFYTVQEYREILQHAVSRNIEVIPEIDMPGHSHAAVKAMTTRYYNLLKKGKSKSDAGQYLLKDIENQSQIQSLDMFSDNVLDPGMESTFTFIDKVVKEIKTMHEDISPLRIFHLGGDEVEYDAWLESPKCQALILTGEVQTVTDIMRYFIKRVSRIVHSHGLDLGVWQDGIVMKKSHMFERSDFDNDSVVVYAWKNVWETGMASDSVKLANAGYKVVMAQATHLYFDHAYEPDPEERGLYWSGRYLDTRKVFGFIPDSVYANADVKMTGEAFTEDELKKLSLGDHNKLERPENIIGLQSQLWCELIRTPEQLQEMFTPRIIALAERAWHKAPWEEVTDRSEQELRKRDWADFALTLGTKELQRLEEMKIAYHLPPPGAILSVHETGRMLTMNCAYPGLPMYYSLDDGQSWTRYTQPVSINNHANDRKSLTLITRSFSGQRSSRRVQVKL